jgi:hypothetical protein
MSHLMTAYAEVAAAYGNVDPNDELAVQRFYEVTFQEYGHEKQQNIVDEIFIKSTGVAGSATPSLPPTEPISLRHSEGEAIQRTTILSAMMGNLKITEDAHSVTAEDTISEFLGTMRVVRTDRYPREEHGKLSPQDLKILGYLSLGKTHSDIAQIMNVSEGVLLAYVHTIFQKLCDRQTLAALLQCDVKTSPLKSEVKETPHKT